MADSQSQWPAQYPRSSQQGGYQVQQPPGNQAPPPAGYPAPPPAGSQAPPPAGYPAAPPAGYYASQPAGYQPAGYQAAGYQAAAPGYQGRMMSSMLASSADRERAVDVLKAGFAEGRLSQDEYNERMGRAYAARTYGDLAALTSDLPAGALPLPQAWPVQAYRPAAATNTMAVASMVLGVAEFFTAGLTAIPAVVCGHIARRQIRQTSERGEGLATGGLVLGYLAIVFWAIIIGASLVGVAFTIAHGGSVQVGNG